MVERDNIYEVLFIMLVRGGYFINVSYYYYIFVNVVDYKIGIEVIREI